MPTTASEELLTRSDHLNANIQDAEELIRRPLGEKFNTLIANLRDVRVALEEILRMGCEKQELLRAIPAVRQRVERAVEFFTWALNAVKADATLSLLAVTSLQEALQLAEWIRSLEKKYSAPEPPIDEAVLPSAPDTMTAEGYVSISEARKRLLGQR
jgi:hypothetical protein